MADHTPNDELRELVEEWRATASKYRDRGFNADYHSYKECADDLEELLQE